MVFDPDGDFEYVSWLAIANSVYGIDEGLRVMSRVPHWIQHLRVRADDAQDLLDAADELRERLDRTIARSYRRGQPPGLVDQRRVAKHAERIEDLWLECKARGRQSS